MNLEWLAIVCGIVGSAFGAFVGVKVAIATLKERVSVLEVEVKSLRECRHEHANFLTQHELRITNIERRMSDGR